MWEETVIFLFTDSQIFMYNYNHPKWDLITFFLSLLLNKVLLSVMNQDIGDFW